MSSNFEQLPDEVLLKIFYCTSISAEDLISLSNVCQRFQNVCCSEEKLWKSKFEQRWPLVWKKIDGENMKTTQVINWKHEVEVSLVIWEKFRTIFNSFSHELYQYKNITSPILSSIKELFNIGKFGPLIILNELYNIIKDESGTDLTNLYYAKKLLYHVNYYLVSGELREFLKLSPQKQSLEKGICILGKAFRPEEFSDFESKEASLELNSLASEVLLHLLTINPDHPATSIELYSPEEPLEISVWSDKECEEVIDCIRYIMFEQRDFTKKHEIYNIFSHKLLEVDVSYQDQRMDHYICVIFVAVAHRLRVLLHVNNGDGYLLQWTHPNSKFIEVKHPHLPSNWESLDESTRNCMRGYVCTTKQVLQNMAHDAFCESLGNRGDYTYKEDRVAAAGIILILDSLPNDLSGFIYGHELQYCWTYEIHIEEVINIYKKLIKVDINNKLRMMKFRWFSLYCEDLLTTQQKGAKKIYPKSRTKGVDVKFTTGMIVCHKKILKCGVIIGWDEEYDMLNNRSNEGDTSSKVKRDQPFYILLSDYSSYYAAEENLILKKESVPIMHYDVGKYFKAFNGGFYIPNNELRSQYPDDETARNELFSFLKNNTEL